MCSFCSDCESLGVADGWMDGWRIGGWMYEWMDSGLVDGWNIYRLLVWRHLFTEFV